MQEKMRDPLKSNRGKGTDSRMYSQNKRKDSLSSAGEDSLEASSSGEEVKKFPLSENRKGTMIYKEKTDINGQSKSHFFKPES